MRAVDTDVGVATKVEDPVDAEVEAASSPPTEPESAGASFWPALGRAFGAAGRAIGAAAVSAGRGAAGAYASLDPALTRYVAQMPLVGLASVFAGRDPSEPIPGTHRRVVVCVHGFGGMPGNFTLLRAYLRTMGGPASVSMRFSGTDSIEAMAEELRGALRRVIDANHLPEGKVIDLVAHSMGGVIARVVLDDPEIGARVRTLVTLGTPHGGTELARLVRSTKGLGLRRDSQLMERLARQLPWRAGGHRPRLVAISSPTDVMLMPPEVAFVDGAENVRVPDLTHLSYLTLPRMWQLVATTLAERDETT
jgi:pimeloyl-ACP methyl ester carboxylesterase